MVQQCECASACRAYSGSSGLFALVCNSATVTVLGLQNVCITFSIVESLYLYICISQKPFTSQNSQPRVGREVWVWAAPMVVTGNRLQDCISVTVEH